MEEVHTQAAENKDDEMCKDMGKLHMLSHADDVLSGLRKRSRPVHVFFGEGIETGSQWLDAGVGKVA